MQTARVPVGVAAAVVAGALHGLHAAHEARGERGEPLGIVHRDVSPHNILVGTDGAPRVVDFGVAKASGRIQATRGDQLKGKLAYLAPEQLDRKAIDRRVDVWAASVVLWELLTGKRLFSRETEAESMRAILDSPIEPPGRLDEIVMKGLARDPAQRFETALDMAVALEESMDLPRAHDVGAWVEVAAGDALQARELQIGEIENRSSAAPVPHRKRRWPVAMIALALAAGAAGALLVFRPEAARTAGMANVFVPPLTFSVGSAPPALSSAAPPPPVASAKKHAPPPLVSKPPPTAASSAPPRPVLDCDPPFVVDPSGVKIPKRHCLSR
jgi:serine/threonine-protein kinase